MKSIKELIFYFYKNETISAADLDYLQENGFLEPSDLKEFSAKLRKKKKRKTVQPTEEDDFDWPSGGGGGGSKRKVNLASLIYDINIYAEEHMERWEKDLTSLYHIAELLFPEKKFSDLKSVSESLLKEIRSQPLEKSVNALAKAFKADEELSEKFKFILNYRKPLQSLDKAEFREIKERMVSEKGMRLPSKFIPINRRPGYLTLASMLLLQNELRRIDKALKAEAKLEKDFKGRNFRFHFTEDGEISSLEAVRGVTVSFITLSRGDEIIPTKRGEFKLKLINSPIYRSATGKTAFHITFLEGAFRTMLLQYTEIDNITYTSNSEIIFHPTGAVCAGILGSDQIINGMKFESEGVTVFFHPDGIAERLLFAQDTEINQILYAKESVMDFHSNGTVSVGTLAKDTDISGITYSKGSRIFFYSNGTVSRGCFAKDTEISGLLYLKGSDILFYLDGTVSEGVFAKDTEINGIVYKENSVAFFYPNGAVSDGVLAKDTEIKGITYLEKSSISFHPDSTVSKGTLAKKTEINGNDLPRNSRISFHPDGTLSSGIIVWDID